MSAVIPLLAATLHDIVGKGCWYWLRCVCLIILGLWLGPSLETNESVRLARYAIARLIDEHSPGPTRATTVVAVGIDDQAFWGPKLEGRRPIKRTYLASLMASVAFYRPAVIAVDFDFTKGADYNLYKIEDSVFAQVVDHLSLEQKIVLPRLLERKGETWHPLTTALEALPAERLIRWGFINLNEDPHSIPLTASVIYPDGKEIPYPSLALAAARFHSKRVSEFGYAQPPYARFLPETAFETHTSAEILDAYDPPIFSKKRLPQYRHDRATAAQRQLFEHLTGHIVVVGGAFHSDGPNRGRVEDTIYTPVGQLPGYLLHADYIENLLAERPVSLVSFRLLELLPTVLLSLLLATHLPPLWKYVALSFVVLLYAAITYLGVVSFGIFIETVIPAILVTAHFVIDILLHRS